MIIGNHDEDWMSNDYDISKYFETVLYMDSVIENDKLITLCHYPMFEWNRSRYITSQDDAKSWLIHGHIHNSQTCDAYKLIKEKLFCALNAGIDINNYEPVTFDELLINNNKWYRREK